MNKLLAPASPNGNLHPPLYNGKWVFYARLDEAEPVPAPVNGGVEIRYRFDAFEARSFDEAYEAYTVDAWQDFYDRVPVYLISLHLPVKNPFGIPGDDEGDDGWFMLTLLAGEDGRLNPSPETAFLSGSLFAQGQAMTLLEAGAVPETVVAKLRTVSGTAHIPDATEADIAKALSLVGPLKYAVAYDVGQGNAIGLCESNNLVGAYVDFGGGILANAGTFPAALTKFCFSNRAPVLLTHWDSDHWSSSARDVDSLRSTWIAPRQSVGPSHVALMGSIIKSGNLLFLPSGFQAKQFGHLYLERCTGSGRNSGGMAVTLSERHDGTGKRMLFPGDARYSAIPSFSATAQYLSVVAPHHGADMRNRTAVPACGGAPAARLVYSYGAGNTFGHPTNITRQDHDGKGWRDPTLIHGLSAYQVRETTRRTGAGLGHVYMGWSAVASAPPLACGSKFCALQAQQV